MADGFAFNARQYFDFSQQQQDQENFDAYFEQCHEENVIQIPHGGVTDTEMIIQLSDSEDQEFFSPMKGTESNAELNLRSHSMRRTLSYDSINNMVSEPESDKRYHNVDSVSNAMNGLCISKPIKPKRLASTVSLDDHKLGPKKKCISKEDINRLAQPKKKFSSMEDLTKTDFVSLAEGVTRFQKDTPLRFHSKPQSFQQTMPARGAPLTHTRPQSPKLATKRRIRPATHILSRDEQEKLEMEEAKRFQIKAHPINRKILREPLVATVQFESKPPTRPEPFNLTVVEKKAVEPPPEEHDFHARPAPKSTYNPINPPQVKAQPRTVPQTPTFMKRSVKNSPVRARAVTPPKAFKPSRTEPVPFSFERRDELMKKKKEEFIRRVFEEEKKAREFHARPPPKNVLRSRNGSRSDDSDSITSPKSQKHVPEKPPTPTFKARPASVLKMEPFKPKRLETHYVEMREFHLNTDARARERQEFERRRREKEENLEMLKRQQEEELARLEEEERARLRKEAEVRAQPIKKYKEVHVVPSMKCTQPVSPKFHTDRLRNKENVE